MLGMEMTLNSSLPAVRILLFLGGGIFIVLGGLHLAYTLLDLKKPRRLVPAEASVAQAMANSAVRLSRGRSNMWRAWVGFNFSHSLGLVLFGGLTVFTGAQANPLPLVIALFVLIGCVYLILAILYWFRSPAICLAVGTACFVAALGLSLI